MRATCPKCKNRSMLPNKEETLWVCQKENCSGTRPYNDEMEYKYIETGRDLRGH